MLPEGGLALLLGRASLSCASRDRGQCTFSFTSCGCSTSLREFPSHRQGHPGADWAPPSTFWVSLLFAMKLRRRRPTSRKCRGRGQIPEVIRLPLGLGTSLGWDEVPSLQRVGGSVPNTLHSWWALRGTHVCTVETRSKWTLESLRTKLETLIVTRILSVLGSLCPQLHPTCLPLLSISSSARQPASVLACHRLPGALVALCTRRHDYGHSWGNHVAAVSLLLLLHQACSDTGQVFSTGTFKAFLTFHMAIRVREVRYRPWALFLLGSFWVG